MNTRDVANFALITSFDKLPSSVVAKAKICTLDILGGAIAAHDTKSANSVRRAIRKMGGIEESTPIGLGVKVPAPLAAWSNSILANALDIDDGNDAPTGHAGHHGAVVVPASLSVAESNGSSGRSFIEAVVVGYEVGIRAGYILSAVGAPVGPMGSFGAAAASAKLLQLNKEETTNALSIVDAHNPIGSVAVLPTKTLGFPVGGMTKEKLGWAALAGVVAAILAQEGFTGPGSIYDNQDIDQALLGSMGKEYKILEVYHKPYSSCRLTHAGLDGLLKLIRTYHLCAQDIIKVTVETSSIATRLNNYQPHTMEEAEFSAPFVIGALLVDGEVGPEQISEKRLGDKAILDQAKKVKLEVNPEIDAAKNTSGRDQAIVKIETKDGKTHETRVDDVKGGIGNPFTDDELRDKFRTLSTKRLGERRTEEVIKFVDNLENLSNIRELMGLVSHIG